MVNRTIAKVVLSKKEAEAIGEEKLNSVGGDDDDKEEVEKRIICVEEVIQ